jgi:hypothetical protein
VHALTADIGFVPIIVVWAILMFVGRARKQQQQQQKMKQDEQATHSPPRPHHAAPGAAQPTAQVGLMEDLRRAMEELKRTEMHQLARERSQEQEQEAGVVRKQQPGVFAPRVNTEEARAQNYLASRKRMAAPAPRTPHREQRRSLVEHVFAVADDEGSQETSAHEEATDYDLESLRMADERLRAGTADRGPRPEIAPALASEAPSHKPRSPFARFANGTARGAFAINAILGRPRSELPYDA